jgi:hypothetical protein
MIDKKYYCPVCKMDNLPFGNGCCVECVEDDETNVKLKEMIDQIVDDEFFRC